VKAQQERDTCNRITTSSTSIAPNFDKKKQQQHSINADEKSKEKVMKWMNYDN